MRILKYMIFLVAVMAFMVFFGHKETLSPEETLAITEFENQAAFRPQTPVAGEDPIPGAPTTLPTTGAAATTGSTLPAQTDSFLNRTTPNGSILEDSVNVRSGPGLDFPVVTQLYKGDPVILGRTINGWYELLLQGRKYYISTEWVTLTPIQ